MAFSREVKEEIIDKIQKDIKNVSQNSLIPISIIYGASLTKNWSYESDSYVLTFKQKNILLFFKKMFEFLNIEAEILENFKDKRIKKLKIYKKNKSNEEFIESILKGEMYDYDKKNVVKGMYLAAGYVSNPEKEYHLEIRVKENIPFLTVNSFFEEIGININNYEKQKTKKIYFKSGEDIFNILGRLEANKSLLKFESIRAIKETNVVFNRVINFEMANMSKTFEASIKHIKAIEILEENNYIFKSDEIKIKEARKENMEMSLNELATLLKMKKSTLNSKLNKFVKESERFKD